MESTPTPDQSVSPADARALGERAAHFQELIKSVSYGPGGMIVSFPRLDTRLPFQEGEDYGWVWSAWGYGDPDGEWEGQDHPTVAEIWYGENTLFATGWFLSSQLFRHRATGHPDAHALARKGFLDLNNIFRLCAKIQPGLLGKPHGGRAGPTWSYDQCANPIVFYAEYGNELASSEERDVAVRNLTLHGDLYLENDWTINYYGVQHSVAYAAHQNALKPLATVYACYALTGEERFRAAVEERLHPLLESGGLPWGDVITPTIEANFYHWAFLCEVFRDSGLADGFGWESCIGEYWSAARAALREDGLGLNGLYDTKARTFEPHPEKWLNLAEGRALSVDVPPDVDRWWSSSTCQGPSLAVAWASTALLAHELKLDDDAAGLAAKMLLRVGDDELGFWWDDGTLPDDFRIYTDVFSVETVSLWLAAYWRGKLQGVW